MLSRSLRSRIGIAVSGESTSMGLTPSRQGKTSSFQISFVLSFVGRFDHFKNADES